MLAFEFNVDLPAVLASVVRALIVIGLAYILSRVAKRLILSFISEHLPRFREEAEGQLATIEIRA